MWSIYNWWLNSTKLKGVTREYFSRISDNPIKEQKKLLKFRGFLENYPDGVLFWPGGLRTAQQWWWVDCDHVLFYEEGLKEICGQMGLPYGDTHANRQQKKNKLPYWEQYDSEMESWVREWFAEDIRAFDYKFGG